MRAKAERLFIPILEGTIRPGRRSIYAARLVEKVGKTIDEIEVQLVDPLDYNFPFDGNDPENKDPRYTKLTEKADGFFIVTPEYNHSFPGTLKRMLDSELDNYVHKPVAVAGVSASMWGGVRAIESLTSTVREMGLVITFTDVYFPKISEIFDQDGQLKNEYYNHAVKKAFTELIWMARALKWGRENLPSEHRS